MHTYIFAICCFLSLSFNTMETCSVTVQFTNLRNTKGLVQAALLNGSQGFPDDPKQRFAIGKTAPSYETCEFEVKTNICHIVEMKYIL